MFQLILGISLGIILLFVIVLLITEMAATYPVWKHFDKKFFSSLNDQIFKSKGEGNSLKFLLLILACILGLCIVAFLISNAFIQKETLSVLPSKSNESSGKVYTKLLTDNSTEYGFSFRLQTKWEDGKMYCNNKVSFTRDTTWNITDWRYHLLDKEGFLIKEIVLTPNSFVYETMPGGKISGLVNKFNTDISFVEYQKIYKLQVVLDRKLSGE